MDAALEIAGLWAAFTASHVGLSSLRVRPKLVGALGEVAFLGLYSVVALAIFVPLMWLYFTHKHDGPALWLLPRGPLLSWTLYLAMAVALVLLVASFVNPSPAGMAPNASSTPRGVHWITRHPLVMAFVVFALAHLLPNGFASDVAFFGGFAAFALIAAAHQDSRKRVAGPAGYARVRRRDAVPPVHGLARRCRACASCRRSRSAPASPWRSRSASSTRPGSAGIPELGLSPPAPSSRSRPGSLSGRRAGCRPAASRSAARARA